MEKTDTVRPTKKQRDLLRFIEQFIGEHGYSPSYREIMNGLTYTSVATVALHVNSLINRGHLRKRDRSARSLEVVTTEATTATAPDTTDGIDWLTSEISTRLSVAETSQPDKQAVEDLTTLVAALRLLGGSKCDALAARLATLQTKPAI